VRRKKTDDPEMGVRPRAGGTFLNLEKGKEGRRRFQREKNRLGGKKSAG